MSFSNFIVHCRTGSSEKEEITELVERLAATLSDFSAEWEESGEITESVS